MLTNRELEEELRNAVLNRLAGLGYVPSGGVFVPPKLSSKNAVRELYRGHRAWRLERDTRFVKSKAQSLIIHFADGGEVQPEKITPMLIEVKAESFEADLFRFATLLWSVPVSQGFGRRMRFLVMDRQNGKLIGILGLGDPVFNLRARDSWIGWTSQVRRASLVHVMDAYVLGSVPPYSYILGGKLVAALAATRDIAQRFAQKYAGKRGVISGGVRRPRLALITTTSALGRSSLYNRIVVKGRLLYHPIGYTEGWGHFHLDGELFGMMRRFLAEIGHPYANGHRFGMGPNWKIRVLRASLECLGLSGDLLKHGVRREVYAVPLASNSREFLRGEASRLSYLTLGFDETVQFCLGRWIMPRAERYPSFKSVRREDILDQIVEGKERLPVGT